MFILSNRLSEHVVLKLREHVVRLHKTLSCYFCDNYETLSCLLYWNTFNYYGNYKISLVLVAGTVLRCDNAT